MTTRIAYNSAYSARSSFSARLGGLLSMALATVFSRMVAAGLFNTAVRSLSSMVIMACMHWLI